jgi:hypothetical protein
LSPNGPTVSAEPEAFYVNAYRRIFRSMLVLPVLATPLIWIRWHRASALGFLAGCVVGVVNFYWLKKTIQTLAEKVVAASVRRPDAAVMGTFLLRYVLIAAVGYVIVKSSASSIYGFCAGLFLPVGAILIEAGYEGYIAFRRGF